MQNCFEVMIKRIKLGTTRKIKMIGYNEEKNFILNLKEIFF